MLLAAMALTTAVPSTAQADLPTTESSTTPPAVAKADAPKAGAADSVALAPNWTAGFDEQMATLLTTPDDHRRENAMRLIIEYTRNNPELDIDFDSSIPRLFAIYNDARAAEGERLMALAALQSIGQPYVLKQLARDLETVRSTRVRHVTQAVLSGHLNAAK